MRSRGLFGALAGVLAAAAALGIGEAVAVFVRPAASPVLAVGNRLITLTPESTKRSAIDSFGTNDKTVLIWSIFIGIALFGAGVGRIASANPRAGVALFGVFGLFGAYCAITQNTGRVVDAVPSVVGMLAGAGALWWLVERIDARRAPDAAWDGTDRRSFLVGGAATAGLAAVAGIGGRAAEHAKFDVADERAAIARKGLPKATHPAPALPRGVDLGKGATAFATPAAEFYRIDTAIDPPQVAPGSWSLRIHGKVDREVTLSYDDLLARPLVERWITLCCVSNEVGGDLIGNARWLGVRLADVLREAGIHDDANQLLMTSVDGMTIGAPTEVLLDGREAMIAVGMNGAPLPIEHGFPARIVVPGLYGYVSACKWVTELEATTFLDRQAYWVQGGWAAGQLETGVKLSARIDTPRSGKKVSAGTPVAVAGVAWDQHVGVSKVELQVDDGDWMPARLATVPSTDTWRQWVVVWTPPKSGSYTLRVRATDGQGVGQITNRAAPYPSGATGLHTITVTAS